MIYLKYDTEDISIEMLKGSICYWRCVRVCLRPTEDEESALSSTQGYYKNFSQHRNIKINSLNSNVDMVDKKYMDYGRCLFMTRVYLAGLTELTQVCYSYCPTTQSSTLNNPKLLEIFEKL